MNKKAGEVRINTMIFKKGSRLFEQGNVTPEGETENTAYFAVKGEHEDYKVRVSSNGTFNCTCMRGTLHGSTKGAICSHVVATILYLAERSRREQREQDKKE